MNAKPATLQMKIMAVLKKNEGRMRDRDIAEVLNMPATSMRSSLYLLVDKGLVRST